MINYVKTLVSVATLMAMGAHFIEDVALITIGRYVPFPWAYIIGIGLSWVVLGLIIKRVELKSIKDKLSPI